MSARPDGWEEHVNESGNAAFAGHRFFRLQHGLVTCRVIVDPSRKQLVSTSSYKYLSSPSIDESIEIMGKTIKLLEWLAGRL